MDPLGIGTQLTVLFVGFGVLIGVLFGFFGIGGSFLVTPALLVSGYPIRVAVGSGLAFVFGTSVVGALRHRTLGQVDYRLAALLVLGMALGIEAGKRAMYQLDALGWADVVVSVSYVGLLALVGGFVLVDARCEGDGPTGPPIGRRLRRIRLPPTVTLVGDREVSVWVVLGVGCAIGVLSGFLGVGGGFLLLPVMVYGFGVPAAVAVGTDILQITAASAYGAYVYAGAGAVSLPAVGTLLAGSAFGARIGVAATKFVDEDDLTGYFAVTLLAGSSSMAAKELGDYLGVEALEALSVVLVFGVPVLVSAVIVFAAVRGLKRGTAYDTVA